MKPTGALMIAFVASLVFTVSPAFASTNQQLVLQDRAGTGFGTFNGTPTPFGFWIWCQTPLNSNAYGNDCAGSVYFYHLGIATGVSGSVSVSGSSYTVTVSGGPVSSCVFTFSSPFTSGATNTVSLSCGSPSGSGTDGSVAIKLVPS